MRQLSLGVLLALMLAGPLWALEVQGTFVKYDESKKVLTVEVQGAKSDYTLSSDTKVTTVKGSSPRQGIKSFADPKVARPGAVLTVVTETREGKDVVTQIILGGRKK